MVEHVHAHPLRALDANGDPVSGAKLYTYLTGTLTAATTYSDEALSTPHASPITADGSGVFPPIYYSGSALKVTVTDPDDVTLPGYPIDPAPLISTGSTGASQVSFSPYTGFTATNLQTAVEQVMALWNSVTTWARTFLTSTSAAQGRTALELGTFAVANTASFVKDQSAWNTGTSTTESTITPAKLQAKIEASTLGVDQSWQDVTASRGAETSYQNTTGRPIKVSFGGRASGSGLLYLEVSPDNSTWTTVGVVAGENIGNGYRGVMSDVIPPGHYYRVTGTVGVKNHWSELR